MPTRLRHSSAPADLDFDSIRAELEVPGPMPADVEAEAVRRASLGPRPEFDAGRVDATDVEFVTIDPPGSTDLDQALAIEALADGWRVRYAIADVAAWVDPGGAIDAEARRRTQTSYAPDVRTPLHPPSLSEGAASLLPDGPRPAVLWTIDVDADGTTRSIDVRRATVRSRAQLDYAGVQASLDDGSAPASLVELPHLGRALGEDARRRGAIELGLPEQEVVRAADGTWTLALRADLPVETWNAEVSLLTGRAAASLMIEHGIGLLRTLPQPDPAVFPRLRAAAANLGIDWPEGVHPGTVLAGLDMGRPKHAAFSDLAAEMLRGAAYTAFEGDAPDDPGHGGVGAPYAHVTAPLRRLIDRYATEICVALAAGTAVPPWVVEAMDWLPKAMAEGDTRSKRFDRAVLDATEAFVLADRVGDVFAADVIETGERFGTVVLDEPPVRARCDTPDLPLGHPISVRCTMADLPERKVRFEQVP